MHRFSTIMRHNPILFLLLCEAALGILQPMPCVQAQTQQPEHSTDRIRFERINMADGLASPIVRTFLQDRQGFLWIATNGGLNRYDGYTFERVVRGIDTYALAEDHQGRIWIGTGGRGLSSFDPATGRITHFLHNPDDPYSLSGNDVAALHIDQTGTLWVGTNEGLDRFEPAIDAPVSVPEHAFSHFLHEPDDTSSLSIGTVVAIYEDQAGNLWVGTEGGLNRFDPLTQTFKRYQHEPGNRFSLVDDRIQTINEDRLGTLYIGTCQYGLHRYDSDKDHFERLVYDPAHPARLHAPQGVDTPGSCGRVSIIHEDAAGAFWVGINPGGLKRFDREKGTTTHYLHDPSDPYSLSTDELIDFFEDSQGTRWIGTFLGGINKIVPDPVQIFRPLDDGSTATDWAKVQAVKSIFENAGEQFWIGTQSGDVYRLEASDAFSRIRLNHVVRLPSILGERGFVDNDSVLWGGSREGLYRFDLRTRDLRLYAHDPNDPRSLTSGVVYSIYEDREGVLWVGTAGGLSRLDRTTDTFMRYLPGQFIVTLCEDRGGTLWVGSNQLDGLSRYNRDENRFMLVLPEVSAVALHEDTQGRFWVGTNGSGLLLFDRDRSVVTSSFTIEDGLHHDSVWGITEDDYERLWLLSAAGLSQFEPAREQFINYSETDGFPDTREVILKRQSGELVTGGVEGVTVVLPNQIIPNPHAPRVIVTGLQIFDKPWPTAGLLPASVALANDQNDLTFEYVGLHFAKPEKNRYAYQLEGYDADWREVGAERTARYTSLDPGDYTFRVRAANADGVWNEEGVAVRVTIQPPWWKTTGAYLLYGLLFLGGVFAADRIQRRRLIRREREKAQAKELAQAREIEQAHTELQQAHTELKATQQQLIQQEKMASLGQLTAGIAHEIMNPLNFVNNFAGLNEELTGEMLNDIQTNPEMPVKEIQETITGLKVNASRIAKHGKRADEIVKSMMQHAASSEGERYEVAINPLVDDMINITYSSLQSQKLDLEVVIEKNLDESAGSLMMAPREIGRVLQNILGNAFDVVFEKKQAVDGHYEPKISVSTSKENGQVMISIADNGSGMSREVRDRVFEPFFTTKPAGSGTGLGLSLSYDIVVKGHGGSLTVESTEGEGSTFVIILPSAVG